MPMNSLQFKRTAALGLAVFCLTGASYAQGTQEPPASSTVSVVFFGDIQDATIQGRSRDAYLIDQINAQNPDFTVFIGDIKGGQPCTDAEIETVTGLFQRLESPLIYTPGDNEWTDCWQEGLGGFDPIERKDAVLEAFTRDRAAFNDEDFALNQQPDRHENARWTRENIVFSTLHIVGSNNNMRADATALDEHMSRSADNLSWMAQTFDHAHSTNAAAVVLVIHANPKWDAPIWEPSGFTEFRSALRRHALDFERPILIVHGDSHTFTIDRPIDDVRNLMRLEVFGPPERGGIKVEIDPNAPYPFSFSPFATDDREG